MSHRYLLGKPRDFGYWTCMAETGKELKALQKGGGPFKLLVDAHIPQQEVLDFFEDVDWPTCNEYWEIYILSSDGIREVLVHPSLHEVLQAMERRK